MRTARMPRSTARPVGHRAYIYPVAVGRVPDPARVRTAIRTVPFKRMRREAVSTLCGYILGSGSFFPFNLTGNQNAKGRISPVNISNNTVLTIMIILRNAMINQENAEKKTAENPEKQGGFTF